MAGNNCTISSAVSSKSMFLVTGACGSIGPVLVQHLLDQGYKVRVFVRSTPLPDIFPESVQVFLGDINDSHAVRKAMKGTDVVFHLAAKLHINDPRSTPRAEYNRVNVDGTRLITEEAQAAGVNGLIFFSTINVYGPTPPDQVWDETSPLRPQSTYAQSKCEAEAIALSARQRNSNEYLAVVLRLSAVYGSRLKGNYARLVQAMRKGYFIPIGSGCNQRTLVYDEDVATAALLAAQQSRARGQVYNVTDGQIHTFTEILNAISQAFGRCVPKYYLPGRPARFFAGFAEKGFSLIGKSSPINKSMVDKLLENVAVSGEKIQRELGFQPQFDLIAGWHRAIRQYVDRM